MDGFTSGGPGLLRASALIYAARLRTVPADRNETHLLWKMVPKNLRFLHRNRLRLI